MKKKLLLLSIEIFFIGLIFGQTWTVKLKLINDTQDEAVVYVKQSDQMNSSQNVLCRIKLSVDQQKDTSFKVNKYSILTSYATLKKGGKTESSSILINKNNLNFSPELNIPQTITDINKPTLTDFTNSSKLLEYDPSKFLNKSITPKPSSELFNQYLGGIAICIQVNGKDSLIDKIEPQLISSEIKPYYYSAEDKKEFYFSNQLDQNIKGSIPGITELGVNFNTSKLYHLKIVYKGIGEIGWKNDKNIDLISNFTNSLPLAHHYKLAKYKLKYGDSLKLYLINKAYCFEGIYYQLSEMKKIDENHTLNASVFFVNNGNYKNEDKTTIEKTLGGGFLGYWSDNAVVFTELLDFSLSSYYAQQRNLFASLPEEEVKKRFLEMGKLDSTFSPLSNKASILAYLDSYVNSYKLNNPNLSNNSNLIVTPIATDKIINNLSINEINSKYDALNENLDFLLPKDAGLELKKKYLNILK
ncbi:hypothetical protein QE382_003192 [Sphingobacterium zeae]|uniref:Uncharacterized protein n=1 Tax=Sphingobacterium zeae TaxID=1776859 RepID=A0ABU0U8D2_9SPHI|nr:hypothetical protein [Sphingobacterium zeae]MDQ1151208.1 hypothetical protein [Sphingobacterium zeae]